jgi:hypothetical protein
MRRLLRPYYWIERIRETAIAARSSKNLKAHGDSQEVIAIATGTAGTLLWSTSIWVETPMIPPEVYGHLVTSINASVWAAWLFWWSAMLLIGIGLNGRWRWSPLLRLAGSFGNFLAFSFFSLSVYPHSHVETILIIMGVYGAVFGWFTLLNALDLWGSLWHWEKREHA